VTGPGRDAPAEPHAEDYDDSMRDALALYRAMLDLDTDAAMAVVRNTRCTTCLCALSAQVGLWLVSGPDDVLPCGRFHPEFAEEVRDGLALLQPEAGLHP
jgi:hypothetical protein